MSRYNPNQSHAARVFEAADALRVRCLRDGGSLFSDARLWTQDNFAVLVDSLSSRLDGGGFYDSLATQLADKAVPVRQLMAEVLWLYLLVASSHNVRISSKRERVLAIWNGAGSAQLQASHPLLADDVLGGVGGVGAGYSSNIASEIAFALRAFRCTLPAPRRGELADDAWAFAAWLDAQAGAESPQFYHALVHVLFPDAFERIFSRRDKREFVELFDRDRGPAPKSRLDVDRRLLAVRERLQAEAGSTEFDFYTARDAVAATPSAPREPGGVAEPVPPQTRETATNLILYGPPGTGKTHALTQLRERYTDRQQAQSRDAWLLELVASTGWRPVIAAALVDIGKPAKSALFLAHPLILAKAKERNRTHHIGNTVWSYLQEHTPESDANVRISIRRPPYLFGKSASSEWRVLEAWRDEDPESAELFDRYRKGPAVPAGGRTLRRYELVTFHPSFSYEEFVEGIRPVPRSDEDEQGDVVFRPVDGVFKRICMLAHADPSRRYALLIDEINRANIAKVFGELITLIEPDKRVPAGTTVDTSPSGLWVTLPTTQQPFAVPDNLDIYGAMNTADRSIALLDIALRRRFQFRELQPDPDFLRLRADDGIVEGVDLGALLEAINERIEFLLDREHRIGHAYLHCVETLKQLQDCFRDRIVPLLQEYFFEDWSRIALVLSPRAGDESAFVARESLSPRRVFGRQEHLEELPSECIRYSVRPAESWQAQDFIALYRESGAG